MAPPLGRFSYMYLKREWAPLLSDKNTLTAERSNLRFGLIDFKTPKSTGYKKEAQEYGIILNIHDQTCKYLFILCGAGGGGAYMGRVFPISLSFLI